MDKIEEARPLVRELLDLGEARGAQAFLTNNGNVPPKIRTIGKELNRIGGMQYMQAARHAVLTEVGGSAARCLKVAWNGIGEWRG